MQNIFVNYLESLAVKLKQLLDKLVTGDRKLVLMQIVTTLASVADAAEKKFIPYYDWCVHVRVCVFLCVPSRPTNALASACINASSLNVIIDCAVFCFSADETVPLSNNRVFGHTLLNPTIDCVVTV